jgi:tetratricopeptide (TPR) repeat protein
LLLAAALLLTALVDPKSPLADALAQGDAYYTRRAEGRVAGVARPELVDRAISEYRRALNLDPSSYEARLGLLRAYFFRGGFCNLEERDQIALFDPAKKLAEETVKKLDVDLARRQGRAARDIAPSAEIYMWAAVSWGEWAVSHKVSAAFQGAPARIRDLASAVIQIDPVTEQGGGLAVLGRLHNECPRVPFLTGWVSRSEGLRLLRQARAAAPLNPANAFFLAEALIEQNPGDTTEARRLLEWSAHIVPRPEYLVEDAHYAAQARELLSRVAESRVADRHHTKES